MRSRRGCSGSENEVSLQVGVKDEIADGDEVDTDGEVSGRAGS